MSSLSPDFIVDSATGIDVALPVAGPGARSYAFIIDWHVRVLLALAWYVAAGLIYYGALTLAAPSGHSTRWFAAVLLPALAIYFLYHAVLELVMRGRTPGKRLAGVRIVARNGSTPGAGALLIRNVFRLLDSLPVFYGVGLMSVTLTRENLRIGDMAAGTLLIYERPQALLPQPAPLTGRPDGLDPAAAELIAELLQRWPELTVESRGRLARRLLARHGAVGEAGDPADDDTWRVRLEQLARRGSS